MATQEFTPKQLIIGCHQMITGAIILLAGIAYSAGAVLGRVTATGKYTLVDNSKNDGTEIAKYILAGDVDATSADSPGIAYKTGQFNEAVLTFGGNDTADDHREALEARGIFMATLSAP